MLSEDIVLLVFVAAFVLIFSVYLAIEAMKAGMCKKKWFFAAMCLGPFIWPMFNMKKQMHFRKLQRQQKAVSLYF